MYLLSNERCRKCFGKYIIFCIIRLQMYNKSTVGGDEANSAYDASKEKEVIVGVYRLTGALSREL